MSIVVEPRKRLLHELPHKLLPLTRTRQAPAPAAVCVRVVGLVAAGAVGLLVSGGLPIPAALRLPPVALMVVALMILSLPVLLRRWRLSLGVFLAWLAVEDLVRKLAGNDLHVYFVKDLLFAVLLAALVADPAVRGSWKKATGRSRLALYALMGWAIVMSVPTGLADWRLPLVGLRLDFLYVPLVVVGYQLGATAAGLSRALGWLAALGGATCAVGIIQAVVGPTFLAPGVPTPGLADLALVRGIAASGPVYRPTGTFVDPGRFAAMAVVVLAIALAAILAGRRMLKPVVIASAVAAAGAVWVTGVRGSLTIGIALVAVATASVVWAARRPTLRRPVGILAAGVSAVVLINAFFPVLFSSRLIWYTSTLDPRSPSNEWGFRWGNYSGNTVRGLSLGGVMGEGTGRESLGTQYLYGGATRSSAGLHQVEGGYAGVALEWGAVGLVLWIAWSVAWVTLQWNGVRQARGSPLARAGVVLLAWTVSFLFVDFFAGLQIFQNYTGNAYFWLLSGILFAFPELVKETSGQVVDQPKPNLEVRSRRGFLTPARSRQP
jgi:hypothetical protein